MLTTINCTDCGVATKPHHTRRCKAHQSDPYPAHWEALKAEFVTHAHGVMVREPWTRYFAVYRPSSAGQWARLTVIREGEDMPAGFELVTPERIPGENREGVRRWFERFAGRLPVFPQ